MEERSPSLAPVAGAWPDEVGERARGRTLIVGFTPPAASEFYDEIEHGAFSQMRLLSALFGVQWRWETFAPGVHQDVCDQIEVIHDWAARGFDAVLVCTAGDFSSMQRVYEAVTAQGTRVFQFNMPAEAWPAHEIKASWTIGYDNAAHAGYLAGEYIARKLGGEGKLILIWGLPGHWSTSRFNGLRLALRRYPEIRLEAMQRGDYVRAKGMSAAENLLRRHPDVDAIYAENEEMALGASEAIDACGLRHWDGRSGIITIGADGLKSGYELIKRGKLTATVDVHPVEQGRRSIQAIFWDRVLAPVEPQVVALPTAIVDEHNVDAPLAAVSSALDVPKV
jgi:ABC-type sugar transport system substrate-binding protein